MSEARMPAVTCEPFTNVVARALPFQFSTDPETKPVPFTVSVNPAPPGAMASGTKGWLISGTGLIEVIAAGVTLLKAIKAIKAPIEQRAKPIKTRGLKKADREVDCFCIAVTSSCASEP